MNMENQLFTTLKLNRLCKNVNFSKINLDEIKGQIISIREGEVLFREGDSADSIFLIVSGEINIIKKKLLGKTKSYIYNENTFLGQEDFLEEMSRTSIAVALRDSYLISLSKDEIDRLMAQDIIIAENLNAPIFEFEEDNVNREPEEPEYDTEEQSEPENRSEPEHVSDFKPEQETEVLSKPDFSNEPEIEPAGNFDFKEAKKKTRMDLNSKVGVNTDIGTDEKIGKESEAGKDNNPNTLRAERNNESNILATFDHDFLTGLIPDDEPDNHQEQLIAKSKPVSPWDVTPDFDFTDSDLLKFVDPEIEEKAESGQKAESGKKTEIETAPINGTNKNSEEKIDDESNSELSDQNQDDEIDFSELDEEFNKHLLYAEKFEIPEDEPNDTNEVEKISIEEKSIELIEEKETSEESKQHKEKTKQDYESFLDEELFKLLDEDTYKRESSNPKEISISDLENEEIFKGLNFAEDTNQETNQENIERTEDELNNALFDLLNETKTASQKSNSKSEMDFSDFNFDEEESPEILDEDPPREIPNPKEPMPEIEVPEELPNPGKPEIEIPEEDIPNPIEPEIQIPEEDIPNPKEPEIEIPEEEIPEPPKPELPVNKRPRKSYAESQSPLLSEIDSKLPVVDSELSEVNPPGTPVDTLDDNQLKKIISALELVNSQVKIDDVLQNIIDVGIDLTNCDRGTLYIVDKSKNEIWSKIAIGSETKEIRLKIGEGLAGHVALTGVILNINDVQSDKRFNREYDLESGYVTKNMICFPIKNRDKKIIGVLQLINSKTGAFTKLDEEFLEAISIQKFLQAERIQSLGKMTNFLIQDIKKPILVSKRYTEHLKNKELPDEVTKLIDMILEQLNQVADIVTTTSSYSDGTTILRTINLSLNNTLTDYLGRIEMYVKGKGCRIINEFDKDVTIKLDMKEFYQCYMHIIKNACDAMPEGGIIEISTKKEGKNIKIFFKDNGIGIDDNLIGKIFEPFSSFGKKDGTGLGLSITKKVVEAHNGTLDVKTKIGEGSTFIITLPIVLAL